nr:hypothetical protein DBT53_11330 [Aerococcus mictus]
MRTSLVPAGRRLVAGLARAGIAPGETRRQIDAGRQVADLRLLLQEVQKQQANLLAADAACRQTEGDRAEIAAHQPVMSKKALNIGAADEKAFALAGVYVVRVLRVGADFLQVRTRLEIVVLLAGLQRGHGLGGAENGHRTDGKYMMNPFHLDLPDFMTEPLVCSVGQSKAGKLYQLRSDKIFAKGAVLSSFVARDTHGLFVNIAFSHKGIVIPLRRIVNGPCGAARPRAAKHWA